MDESLVCAKFALPKKYGRREGYIQEAEVTIYNLDVIISVGYRVKSQRGVQFRQWANRVLKQYLIKGYAINERLRHEQISELRQLVQVVSRTLVALTLMIAESKTEEKDVMVKVVVNLINQRN